MHKALTMNGTLHSTRLPQRQSIPRKTSCCLASTLSPNQKPKHMQDAEVKSLERKREFLILFTSALQGRCYSQCGRRGRRHKSEYVERQVPSNLLLQRCCQVSMTEMCSTIHFVITVKSAVDEGH